MLSGIVDETITSNATPGQSEPGCSINEDVHYIPLSFRTRA